MSFKHNLKSILLTSAALLSQLNTFSQNSFIGLESLFTAPKSYTLFQTPAPLSIDGELNEKSWKDTPWTDYFINIEGENKPAPAYKTRVKMLWDEKYLYIAAELEEPHLWANKQPEKDIIFRDNVFKVFIDPDNNVNDDFEIQINPSNKMLFLVMNKPYRDGGVPVTGWQPIGYKSGVKLMGTLNKSDDTDKGWIAEIALPLAAFSFNPMNIKPNGGLRINFLRTNFDFAVKDGVYSKALDAEGKPFPPRYSVWTSQGIVNMHYPERWSYTVFSDKAPGNSSEKFILPYTEQQRKYLWLAYYRQKEYFKKNKRYASSLEELNIPEESIIEGKKNSLKQESTSKQFLISIKEAGSEISISVDQDGLISNL
ncbi:carbohydrate-binding family 9-like protein [Daejeonella sp. H1SJ63]|uniref:carbohydrate-binding family 9-like protein n=1 Tax=Daejeonella sp. H1SJ63 TaxID=3034145 RepID=UPI0023EB9A7A|nr:carbohydrate-binding family 9-like protein [Daejeonella sp. H1SJ63]